jgi:hypothetical protein
MPVWLNFGRKVCSWCFRPYWNPNCRYLSPNDMAQWCRRDLELCRALTWASWYAYLRLREFSNDECRDVVNVAQYELRCLIWTKVLFKGDLYPLLRLPLSNVLPSLLKKKIAQPLMPFPQISLEQTGPYGREGGAQPKSSFVYGWRGKILATIFKNCSKGVFTMSGWL